MPNRSFNVEKQRDRAATTRVHPQRRECMFEVKLHS
jgi:hypothetical protein